MTTENIRSGLYIVSTPIGNLKDITYRAIEILSSSDIILCEDTRTSNKLLSAYNIHKKLISLHEYNERGKIQFVLQLLNENKVISLISDAGTPLISDPGYNLVKHCIDSGYYVTSVPGVSSVITALTLSTFPTNNFFFSGFLPNKSSARVKLLNSVKQIQSTLIFFETSNRLLNSLNDISRIFPENKIVIAKELTKLFEQIIIGTADYLIEKINIGEIVLKGEIVLLISNSEISGISLIENKINLNDPNLGIKEISKLLSVKNNIPQHEIYRMLCNIKKRSN